MEWCPEGNINAIDGMQIAIKHKRNRGIERTKPGNICARWRRKATREDSAIWYQDRIASSPYRLDKYGGERGKTADSDAKQHHDVWRNKCAIPSNKIMPLNVPTYT